MAPTEGQLTVTEEQVIALFYQRNLSLIAASLNIDSAQAQEIIAAAIPNPVFSFTVHELAPKAFRGGKPPLGSSRVITTHSTTYRNGWETTLANRK